MNDKAAAKMEGELLELEETGVDPGPDMDLKALEAAADDRIKAMKAAGRSDENIAKTYSAAVKGILNDNKASISDSLRLLATQRRAMLDARSGSEAYKRKALCSEVLAGEFDVEE